MNMFYFRLALLLAITAIVCWTLRFNRMKYHDMGHPVALVLCILSAVGAVVSLVLTFVM